MIEQINLHVFNQTHIGLWQVCALFLVIASVCKCVFVCVSTPEAINN